MSTNKKNQSLANRYRPNTFDTLVGQEHVSEILKAKIKNPNSGHSNFLFFGPRGTGKTSSARILAKAINCLDLQDGNPCNQCLNCKTIDDESTLDYIEIDAASHTGVDNIREEVIQKSDYPPTVLKKKVYVIDEVHMLSKNAFNALLKTIEEPKDTLVFILATTDVHKVLETIVSRCQVFNFRKVGHDAMINHLSSICTSENLNYTLPALELITEISEGCVRDAIKYVDQVSILGELNEEHIGRFLGIASKYTIEGFLAVLRKGNVETLFQEVDKLNDIGLDLGNFTKQLLMYIDKNIQKDIGFLVRVAESVSEIISNMRYYPYPEIVYKIVFYKYFVEGSNTPNPSPQKEILKSPTPIQAPIPTPTQQPVEAPIEKKVESTQSLVDDIMSPPSSSNTSQSTPSPSNDLLGQLLARIDKPSLQTNLKDHVFVEQVNDNHIRLIVINKFTFTVLEKNETKRYLQDTLTEIIGHHVDLDIVFQNKEEYFEKLHNQII